MMDAQLSELSQQVGLALTQLNLTLATAESCTGGWVAQVVTHTPGSSSWFDRGFITYSNDAKVEMLGTDPETIARYGAVSQETVAEMAA
ncbi:MAG: nicotinamide-nucleotide amidohydrolase family protein, partial [Rhodocyclales bacterium]|nr:nicotinamide-nucleotide amidohydrolase family protein [Rhodocyclales bacterium]